MKNLVYLVITCISLIPLWTLWCHMQDAREFQFGGKHIPVDCLRFIESEGMFRQVFAFFIAGIVFFLISITEKGHFSFYYGVCSIALQSFDLILGTVYLIRVNHTVYKALDEVTGKRD